MISAAGSVYAFHYISLWHSSTSNRIPLSYFVPSSLVSSFHFLDILVEPFALLFAKVPKIVGKFIKVGVQNMEFQIHKTYKRSKVCNHFRNDLFVFRSFPISQKVLGHCLKTKPGFFSNFFILLTKVVSLNIVLICGSSNTSSLNLASDSLRNFFTRYWKHCPVLLTAFTNCFISPSFIWRGGIRIFDGFTKDSWMMLHVLGANDHLFGHFFYFNNDLHDLYYPTSTNSKDVLWI